MRAGPSSRGTSCASPSTASSRARCCTPSGTSGAITLTASEPLFQAVHAAGTRFRIGGKRVIVTAVASPMQASATVEDAPLDSAAPTLDWDESAFSWARGWPVCLCFHQDRLVIGGSRDLPNRLWLSRTGDLFNFDLGTGLDDQAIEFGLVSDQVNAIRGVFSGGHLQVFTSGAEWMVSGTPLTPASIQLHRQTRVGAPVARMIQPVDVDGSTIFASRSGRGIYEFAYTEAQLLYQANDLALASQHLVRDPVSLCYDQTPPAAARGDGRWQPRHPHALPRRGGHRLDAAGNGGRLPGARRDRGPGLGGGGARRQPPPGTLRRRLGAGCGAHRRVARRRRSVWRGLGHLEAQDVAVVADGAPRGGATVLAGAVALDPPALTVQVGLGFRHLVEPLPPDLSTPLGVRAAPLRLVSVTFRLLETAALAVDLGRGPSPVAFRRLGTALLDAPPPRFTGDVRLRALGWSRDAMRPLWRIEDDTPLPMTLLSVTTETRITD